LLNQIAAIHGTGVSTPAANPSYESIATFTLGSSTSSIEFTSIPSTFKHLQVRMSVRGADNVDGSYNVAIQLNGITSSVYSYHGLEGDGSSAIAFSGATQSSIFIGRCPSPFDHNATSNFNGMVLDILDYTDTNKYTTTRNLGGVDANGNGRLGLYSGSYQQTTAVSSLKIYLYGGNLATNSKAALYGIKG
jgi:hypothetical protein